MDALREALDLGAAFRDDPLATGWVVANAVFAVGDQVLEVVAPTRPGTAAGRHLERRGGPAGYMAMFQVDDVGVARERARAAGARIVWEHDEPSMSGTHLDPRDVPGAIVALDQPRPADDWLWAGPGWRERAVAGGLAGVTVAVPDPAAVAARWAEVLGQAPPGVTFAAGDGGLAEIALRGDREPVDVLGVRFTFAPPALRARPAP